jgi:tripartite-type tricarboxylate transporter receptor subunit TctC
MAEQGYTSSQVNSWYALAVPKKTPRAAIERLNRDVNALLGEPETIARFDKIGATLIGGWTPAQTTKMIAEEYARWADVAKKAGLTAQ